MHIDSLTPKKQRPDGQGGKKRGASMSSLLSRLAKHSRQQRCNSDSDCDSDVVLVYDPKHNAEEVATTAQLKPANQRQETTTSARNARHKAQPEHDDDVQMVAEVGQDAGRHLPHCRVDCLCHPFIMGVALANRQHCPQCFCFVCDCRASQCAFWGTGARAEDHANGRAVSYWLKLRTAARAGDTVQVKAAYRAGTATAHAPAPVPAAAAAVAHDSRGNRKSKSSTIKDGKTGDGTSGSGSGSRDHGKESAKKASAEQVAAAAAAAARHKAAVAAAVLNPVSSAGLRWAAAAAAAKQELRAKRLALLAKKMKSETPLLPPSRTVAAKQLPGGTAKVRPAVQPARKESGAGAVAVAGAGAGPGAVAGGAASAGLEAESRKSSKSLRKRIAASLVVAVEKRRKA